jgi:SNF2-related domain
MLFVPRPYQPPAHQFVCEHWRANLYADPGLGKTAVILWMIESLGLEDVLIVAPWLVVREVWVTEPQKWRQFEHLKVVPIIGDKRERSRQMLAPPRIAAVNYELLVWLFYECGESWPFKTVIFDESPRLKGFRLRNSTKRANALAQHAHSKIDRWVNLTGTPNANGYLDLWGPQWFIDGGAALGRTYQAFIERWFYRAPGKKGFYTKLLPLPGAQEDIQTRLKPSTFAVRAKDYFDLKDPIERTVTIELPENVRTQYRSMERKFYAELHEGKVTALNCGVKAMKLRQFASGAVYYEEEHYAVVHAERLEALESIATETAGANLLIVYQFVHEREQILERFKDATDIHVPHAIDDWNANRLPKLLLHARSAGHGLNLQHGGHHIVFYTPYSDNELYIQVLERIGPVRQLQAGFDRPVYVHHIEARQTVDQVTRRARELRCSELEAFLEVMAD